MRNITYSRYFAATYPESCSQLEVEVGGEVTGDKRKPDFFSTSFLIRKRRVEGVILRVDVVPFRLLICQSVW